MALNTTKPTANTVSMQVPASVVNAGNAYDGAVNDTTTSAGVYGNGNASHDTQKEADLTVHTFTAMPVQAYTAKTLNINAAVSLVNDPSGLGGDVSIEYSLNGGASWSYFPGWVSVTGVQGVALTSVSLSPTQDETLVQVRMSAIGWGNSALADFSQYWGELYDVWIEGLYGGVAGSGKKAAAAINC
jgi:hypothetical protein